MVKKNSTYDDDDNDDDRRWVPQMQRGGGAIDKWHPTDDWKRPVRRLWSYPQLTAVHLPSGRTILRRVDDRSLAATCPVRGHVATDPWRSHDASCSEELFFLLRNYELITPPRIFLLFLSFLLLPSSPPRFRSPSPATCDLKSLYVRLIVLSFRTTLTQQTIVQLKHCFWRTFCFRVKPTFCRFGRPMRTKSLSSIFRTRLIWNQET